MTNQQKQAQNGHQAAATIVKWLGLEQWLKQYKPVQNEALQDENHPDDCMFEPRGQELEKVKAAPVNKVWTLVQEGRRHLLYPGFRSDTDQAYFICEVPWDNADLAVIFLTEGFIETDTGIPEVVDRTEKWKLEVGAQCNRLLDLTDKLEESSNAADQQYAADLRSIINRVAEFEELETL